LMPFSFDFPGTASFLGVELLLPPLTMGLVFDRENPGMPSGRERTDSMVEERGGLMAWAMAEADREWEWEW
jgi:hypothetical protein